MFITYICFVYVSVLVEKRLIMSLLFENNLVYSLFCSHFYLSIDTLMLVMHRNYAHSGTW